MYRRFGQIWMGTHLGWRLEGLHEVIIATNFALFDGTLQPEFGPITSLHHLHHIVSGHFLDFLVDVVLGRLSGACTAEGRTGMYFVISDYQSKRSACDLKSIPHESDNHLLIDWLMIIAINSLEICLNWNPWILQCHCFPTFNPSLWTTIKSYAVSQKHQIFRLASSNPQLMSVT